MNYLNFQVPFKYLKLYMNMRGSPNVGGRMADPLLEERSEAFIDDIMEGIEDPDLDPMLAISNKHTPK